MASNPKAGDSVMATGDGKPMVGDQASHFADLTIVYTTDDPGITPDSSITVADGDAATVTRAEYNNLMEEVCAKCVSDAVRILEKMNDE